MMQLGENIKALRKRKNISQETLANVLGVSFQTVSKWENFVTMPDISMLPAIAYFFGVTTDELLSFNLFEAEKEVEKICQNAYEYRDTSPAKSEEILRKGLQRFPGNDILLNNLLYTLDYQTRSEEVIHICKALIETTKDDSVKYDACRILALCYKENGQKDLIEAALEKIPEIYFTKLELMAALLETENGYEAAQRQKRLSAESLVNMLIFAGKYLKAHGEEQKAASQFELAWKILDTCSEDFLEDKYFKTVLWADAGKQQEEILALGQCH